MPKPLGIQGFYEKIQTANGPAQIVSYAVWGTIVAGMIWGYCPEHIPNALLAFWGALSVSTLFTVIWLRRSVTKHLLVLDMVVSMVVLMMYVMHEPHMTSITYFVDDQGNFVRPKEVMNMVSHHFHTVGIVWMVLHSAYLANLMHRQELEAKRFHLNDA
jgi:hypothetical protein